MTAHHQRAHNRSCRCRRWPPWPPPLPQSACRASLELCPRSLRDRAASDAVAAYHKARLAELTARPGQALDNFRPGELDAFAADHSLYQYSRSARELWKFRNLTQVEIAAQAVVDRPTIDWWE